MHEFMIIIETIKTKSLIPMKIYYTFPSKKGTGKGRYMYNQFISFHLLCTVSSTNFQSYIPRRLFKQATNVMEIMEEKKIRQINFSDSKGDPLLQTLKLLALPKLSGSSYHFLSVVTVSNNQ